MNRRPELHPHIAIIGGGITGVIAALFLARIFKSGNRPISLTLYERRNDILQGASLELARLHMGGEYPLDRQTADDCVTGAFLFAQIFPKQVFSEIQGIDYLVHADSVTAGKLTVQQLLESYEGSRSLYSDYYRSAAANDYYSPLGDPAKLYRVLAETELKPGIAGGISTNELGFKSTSLNQFLNELIKNESDIQIDSNCHIVEAKPEGEGYRLFDNDSKSSFADIVINSSWESASFLNRKIAPDAEIPAAYLRALGIADISACGPVSRPTFILLDEYGGMFSPVDESKALLYAPLDELSHIRRLMPEDLQPDMLATLTVTSKKQDELKTKLYDHIVKLYPHLKRMQIEKLHISPTFSFDQDISKRRHLAAAMIAPNWYSLICTKATYSVWAALQIVSLIAPESLTGFDLEDCPVVPQLFHLGS
jgi:hypothetical protein